MGIRRAIVAFAAAGPPVVTLATVIELAAVYAYMSMDGGHHVEIDSAGSWVPVVSIGYLILTLTMAAMGVLYWALRLKIEEGLAMAVMAAAGFAVCAGLLLAVGNGVAEAVGLSLPVVLGLLVCALITDSKFLRPREPLPF